jgi:hypothetical protein
MADDDALGEAKLKIEHLIQRELTAPSKKKTKTTRAPFDPEAYGLSKDFRLTNFSALKG